MDRNFNFEINKAASILLNSDVNKLDTLCHGNMGTVEFFLNKYEDTQDLEDLNLSRNLAYNCINSLEGKLHNNEGYIPLGLFNGLAGIGYECLRIYDLERVPSVLTLD